MTSESPATKCYRKANVDSNNDSIVDDKIPTEEQLIEMIVYSKFTFK